MKPTEKLSLFNALWGVMTVIVVLAAPSAYRSWFDMAVVPFWLVGLQAVPVFVLAAVNGIANDRLNGGWQQLVTQLAVARRHRAEAGQQLAAAQERLAQVERNQSQALAEERRAWQICLMRVQDHTPLAVTAVKEALVKLSAQWTLWAKGARSTDTIRAMEAADALNLVIPKLSAAQEHLGIIQQIRGPSAFTNQPVSASGGQSSPVPDESGLRTTSQMPAVGKQGDVIPAELVQSALREAS